jgi:Protein of unknown function (DUF2786)
VVQKTISLPPKIARETEEIAQSEGKTLSAVMQDALRLSRAPRSRNVTFSLPTYPHVISATLCSTSASSSKVQEPRGHYDRDEDGGVIDSSIIEKIQKLRAITEQRGATEDEAIAAEQRMFSLLAKYNLEISQIPEGEPTRAEARIESESAARPGSVWKQASIPGSPTHWHG